MGPSLSVLQNAAQATVHREPFPYLVLRNALPASLCDDLIAQYPPLEAVGAPLDKSNKRWSYPAHKVRNSPQISERWKDFVAYHASSAFLHEVLDVFSDHIRAAYPSVFPTEERLRSMRVGLRDVDTFDDVEIVLDAQISGNTAVQTAGSVRTTHVDGLHKLFAGLFYLRLPDDDSDGGDLEIRRFRDGLSPSRRRHAFKGCYVDNRHTELVETVRYQRNALVMFVNTWQSLHGVTVRAPTRHPRLFLNLTGEVAPQLFDIPSQRRRKAFIRLRKRLLDPLIAATNHLRPAA